MRWSIKSVAVATRPSRNNKRQAFVARLRRGARRPPGGEDGNPVVGAQAEREIEELLLTRLLL